MKTADEWINKHGWDKGVCMGHGDYEDLPKRLTKQLISTIQIDALEEAARIEPSADKSYANQFDSDAEIHAYLNGWRACQQAILSRVAELKKGGGGR